MNSVHAPSRFLASLCLRMPLTGHTTCPLALGLGLDCLWTTHGVCRQLRVVQGSGVSAGKLWPREMDLGWIVWWGFAGFAACDIKLLLQKYVFEILNKSNGLLMFCAVLQAGPPGQLAPAWRRHPCSLSPPTGAASPFPFQELLTPVRILGGGLHYHRVSGDITETQEGERTFCNYGTCQAGTQTSSAGGLYR